MQLDVTTSEEVAVLRISKALMSGAELMPFQEHIRRLNEDGLTSVVVDFSQVKWFGSAMLGVLTTSLTTLLSAGGDLRLTGITKKIDSILMVTQLAGIFQTLDSVEEAIESHTSICK